MPTPYYDHAGITIYHGDCRDVLPGLTADAVVTDPPYGVDAAAWDGRAPYELLPLFMASAGDGPVVWFGAAPKVGEAMRTFDPEPRMMIWAPRFSLSRTMANGVAYRWHPIYVWQLPKKHDGPTWDTIDDATECGNWWNHHCTKPLLLMKKLCGFCPAGGTIIDPFMGSGTTLRAAKDMGRRAIGIEIEERYCEIAAKRLSQEVMQFEEQRT